MTDLPRREAIFVRTCWVLALAMTSFYPAALLQDSRRATLTLVMTTLWILAALAGAALTRRGQLTAGIHTLTLSLVALITIGCYISGRAGPVVWLMLAAIGLGGFHAQPRQFAWLTAAALGSTALIWATLPALDPLQMPVLFILLGVMGIIGYQRAQITQLELSETRDANTRLEEANARLAAANTALDEARARAETANHAKSVFLTTMSHELRTPLNAVIGYAEMLRQDAEDAALDARAAAADLAKIEAGGRQLLGLVSRVLDLSSLESGQFEANVSRFPLTPFLHEVAERIRPAAERAGLTLTLAAPDGPVEVVADRERVSLILANLLTNALQFTPAGQITLAAHLTPDALTFAVTDTGVGIAPEHHARIFDVFTQLDASFTRRVDGAGLGLALCARFAERLGGRLTVESALGQGATFTLNLPRLADAT